jgi:hypothetical protein
MRECVDSFALFLRSFLVGPVLYFFSSYSFLARESERRAHLFIVLIYGNNFICRKAAGNIPRERERERERDKFYRAGRALSKRRFCEPFFRSRALL